MDSLSGCLVARLADGGEKYPLGLIEEINRAVNPPRKVGPDDVYIRAMYIVSDQINSQGGKFAVEELEVLTDLLIDSPVMVGHKRDSLPVARNFKAEKIDLGGRTWVRSYFYWLKDSAGAEDLRNNIDGGIYKECSISFLFRFPECSVCGQDVRSCSHVPFNEYTDRAGNPAIAYFLYRRIERVLETSLVFRGSVPDTRISDKLDDDPLPVRETVTTASLFCKDGISEKENNLDGGYFHAKLHFADSIEQLKGEKESGWYLYPHQPGLVVRGIFRDGKFNLETRQLLPETIRSCLEELLPKRDCQSMVLDMLLYACKGKQRLNALGLMQLIGSGKNQHRLHVRLCDLLELNGECLRYLDYAQRLNRLSQHVGDLKNHHVEIPGIDKIDTGSLKGKLQEAGREYYLFGLEAIEERGCSLTRHIIRPDAGTPAQVMKTSVSSGDRLHCVISREQGSARTYSAFLPRTAAVSEGQYILPGKGSDQGAGCGRPVKVSDILPGIEEIDLQVDPVSALERLLYILKTDDHLLLLFEKDGRWQKATVYHFSRQLFEKGRRFVARLELSDRAGTDSCQARPVRLIRVTGAGRLTHLRIEQDRERFGGIRDLWFRPVLIDGQEKYLFYGGCGTDGNSEI